MNFIVYDGHNTFIYQALANVCLIKIANRPRCTLELHPRPCMLDMDTDIYKIRAGCKPRLEFMPLLVCDS